jgi:hypothetical protein
MLSALYQFMGSKKNLTLPEYAQQSNKYEVIAKLYYLVSKLSEKQKLDLLKQLLGDKSTDYLFKLIIDLSASAQLVLMQQLEEITRSTGNHERRKYPRKDCLINARMRLDGRSSSCFILDLSPCGAFIDTSEGIPIGRSAILTFSSPNIRKHLHLSGRIVWSTTQGAGLEFSHLTAQEREIIRAFTEITQTVYEIAS